jgi:hypothetical protein
LDVSCMVILQRHSPIAISSLQSYLIRHVLYTSKAQFQTLKTMIGGSHALTVNLGNEVQWRRHIHRWLLHH